MRTKPILFRAVVKTTITHNPCFYEFQQENKELIFRKVNRQALVVVLLMQKRINRLKSYFIRKKKGENV